MKQRAGFNPARCCSSSAANGAGVNPLKAHVAGPSKHRIRSEVGPVVAEDHLWCATFGNQIGQLRQLAHHRLQEIEVSTTVRRHSRVTSSSILSKRNRRPVTSWSWRRSPASPSDPPQPWVKSVCDRVGCDRPALRRVHRIFEHIHGIYVAVCENRDVTANTDRIYDRYNREI